MEFDDQFGIGAGVEAISIGDGLTAGF